MDLIAHVDAAWALRWPHLNAFSYELKAEAHDRWVRFHSLPESKRYADTDEEWAILLGRQHAILDDLGAPAELVVVTSNSGVEAFPEGQLRVVEEVTPGTYWRTLVMDDSDPTEIVYRHLYLGRIVRRPAVLDPLLRLVADYVTVNVILAPPDLEWLVAPYDGGTDVIAATPFERDALRARHPDWLPDNPEGL